jgi:hypothetical protein
MLEVFNAWLVDNGHQKWTRETFTPRFGEHATTRRNGLGPAVKRNPAGLVRRPFGTGYAPVGPTPTQVRVWLGVRWRTDDDALDVAPVTADGRRDPHCGDTPADVA